MGWASNYIQRLKAGETVEFRPRGNSMEPVVMNGSLCTVAPVDWKTIVEGDIVLCKVRDNEYLHFVKKVMGMQFQIGNNRGFINGWVSPGFIYGKLIRTQPAWSPGAGQ